MNRIRVGEQELNDIDLFIFDKDGTLIDIHHYWCSMIKIRAEFLIEKYQLEKDKIYLKLIDAMGIDVETNRMKSTGPVGIKPRSFIIETAFNTLLENGVDCSLEDVSDIFKKVDEHSKGLIKDLIKLLPGVRELLVNLTENGIPSAIATTDLSERAKLAMDAVQIKEVFSMIAGGNCAKSTKPAPDLVHFICKRMEIPEERTVVVGDSIVDLKMASNAGARFIGVRTGLYSDEFIENSDFLIETLEQVKIEQ